MATRGSERLTAWLGKARAGDRSAFDQLFNDVSSERCLLVITVRLPPKLRSKLGPEDLLQETRIEAWRDIAQLREVSTAGFHRWVVGIAEHVVADAGRYYHRRKRDVDCEERFDRSAGSKAFEVRDTPRRSISRQEQVLRIVAVLDELGELFRSLIILRVLESCPTAEVGRRLGLEPRTVRSKTSDALRKLRANLKAAGIESTLFRST